MEQFDLEEDGHLLRGLTEPAAFVKCYNGVVNELNLIGKKYNVDISNCICIERGKHGVAFRITEAVNEAGSQVGNLVTEIFVAMHKNYLSPLEFVFVETKANEVYKLINERVFSDGDSISAGSRIFKTSLDKVPFGKPYYLSLEDLILYDPEYLEIKRTNSKWSETISKPESIVILKDFVLTTKEGDENSLNWLLLTHSISGNRERKHFTGVHHIELPVPEFIKDFVVINTPDKNGVFKATFKILKSNGRLISKKDYSSMFPTFWSVQQFYFECYHAIQNKTSIDGSITDFIGETYSGVPVKIFFSPQGRFRTIYPTYLNE